jgi:Fe-S-cluster containining protein
VNPIIALDNIPINEDIQELGPWLRGHGCEPLTINNGKAEVLAIRIPSICKFLQRNDDGRTSCLIYTTRPKICKMHWCKDVIKEEMIKNINKENIICTIPTLKE